VANPRPVVERLVVPAHAAEGPLAKLGLVERIAGTDFAVVHLAKAVPSARAAWRLVLDSDSALAWAAPVLVDEQGEELFPTGEVSVRFRETPSEAALAAFARRHGLVLRRRNEFVPSQAVFVPANPRQTYLPAVRERVVAAPDVTEAWANTVSRYRRV
jgi:hypothetical protein